ncbi:hypothetical protein, partial [Streptomyces sp. DSM 41493]
MASVISPSSGRRAGVAGFDLFLEVCPDGARIIDEALLVAASAELAKACAGRGGPALVIGSTGFSAAELNAIAEAARTIAIVRSGSYSLGLNMLTG